MPMDSTLLRATDSSSHLIKSGDPSCVVNKLPVAKANQLKFTRLARPVQVHKSHSVIYSSANPEGKTFDNASDIGDVPRDKICSYCNVGVVENNFTFAGVLLCVICFPFGFAWLFCMTESQCPHCGKIYL